MRKTEIIEVKNEGGRSSIRRLAAKRRQLPRRLKAVEKADHPLTTKIEKTKKKT